jgi:hypothetical protein
MKAGVEAVGRVSLGKRNVCDQLQSMPLKLDAKSQASNKALRKLGQSPSDASSADEASPLERGVFVCTRLNDFW